MLPRALRTIVSFCDIDIPPLEMSYSYDIWRSGFGNAADVPWYWQSDFGMFMFLWHIGMRIWGTPQTNHTQTVTLTIGFAKCLIPMTCGELGFGNVVNIPWYAQLKSVVSIFLLHISIGNNVWCDDIDLFLLGGDIWIVLGIWNSWLVGSMLYFRHWISHFWVWWCFILDLGYWRPWKFENLNIWKYENLKPPLKLANTVWTNNQQIIGDKTWCWRHARRPILPVLNDHAVDFPLNMFHVQFASHDYPLRSPTLDEIEHTHSPPPRMAFK